MTRYTSAELARGAAGALIGIAVAGATAKVVPGGAEALPFIVAPMGAAAVLLFAVPASPLAQPWPVVGGNIIDRDRDPRRPDRRAPPGTAGGPARLGVR